MLPCSLWIGHLKKQHFLSIMNGFILLIIYERIYLSNTSLGYGLKIEISLMVKSTNRWTVILKKWDIVRYISFAYTRL